MNFALWKKPYLAKLKKILALIEKERAWYLMYRKEHLLPEDIVLDFVYKKADNLIKIVQD